MDPNTAIHLGGSLASSASLAVSLLQWLRSERAAEVKLTVDEYLEWLRRQHPQEILRAIEGNEEAIAELRGWIGGIKDSVFRAVLSLVVVIGTLMYLIEGPEAGFTSIPTSVYWGRTAPGRTKAAQAIPIGRPTSRSRWCSGATAGSCGTR